MATINHKTYNEGTETFKDFSVYDGKDTLIFKVDGSAQSVTITGPNVGNSSLIIRNANNANSGEILLGGTTFGSRIIRDSVGADQDLLIVNSHGSPQGFKFRTGATTAGTTDLMVITGAGNVGIGTSSPTGKLDVTKAGKGTIAVLDNSAFAVGVGGSIDLGGNYRSTGDFGAFTRIAAEKSNATDGNFGFDLGFYVTTNGGSTIGTKVATMTSTGVLDLAQGQIKFPATQVPSADPNTLDDYEEGTWTGTLRGNVSDPTTAVTATGRYTKIGRVVTAEIQMDAKDTTGASGNVTVTGLPFTSSVEAQGAMMSELYDFGPSCTSANCFVSPFSTTLTFFTSGSGVGWDGLKHNAGAGRSLRGTVTYLV